MEGMVRLIPRGRLADMFSDCDWLDSPARPEYLYQRLGTQTYVLSVFGGVWCARVTYKVVRMTFYFRGNDKCPCAGFLK